MIDSVDFDVKRGDIFYISPGPSTGSEQHAGRPGIIVSNDVINKKLETVEIIYTTTREKSELQTRTPVYSTLYESTALAEQITTVSIKRLGNRLGKCSEEEMMRIDRCLRNSIAIEEDNEKVQLMLERDLYKKLYDAALQRLCDINASILPTALKNTQTPTTQLCRAE